MIDEPRKDVAMVYVKLPGETVREDVRDFPGQAKAFGDELKRVGRDFFTSVNVTSYIVGGDEDLGSSYYDANWPRIWKLVELQAPGHTHNYLHALGGSSTDSSGASDDNGPHCWTINPGWKLHENGHCMLRAGHHSNGASNYGGWSNMGSRGLGYAFPHLDRAKLIEPGLAVEMQERQARRVFFVHPEARRQAVPPGAIKGVYLGNYCVCYQNFLVRILRTNGNWYRIWTVDDLTEGERASVNDIDVHFVGMKNGMAEVSISWKGGVPGTIPTPVHPVPQDTHDITDIPGIWHNPGWNHQGIHFHVSRGEIVGYWFTHGNDEQRWFVLQGPIRNGIAFPKIYTVERGELVEVGEGRVHLRHADAGTFTYWLDDTDYWLDGVGWFPLTRLSRQIEHPLAGSYHFDGTEHQGVSVAVHEIMDKGTTRTYFVAYDFRHKFGSQSWGMSEGFDPRNLKTWNVTGGKPGIETKSRMKEVGTANITRNKFVLPDTSYDLKRLIGETEKAA